MWEKLDDIRNRFRELDKKLADPKIIQDQKLFRDLSKEHADLRSIVSVYEKYCRIRDEITENEKIAGGEQDSELAQMAREEIKLLSEQMPGLEAELRQLLLPKDPNDEKNIFLEIRAGTGGDEAALFAADLFRMYCKFADRMGWRVEIMNQSYSTAGGSKEIIACLSGKGAYSYLKYEMGVHRVQRIPATENQGRIHTSTVTVAVLPEADEVELEIKEADLRVDVFRSSGPGGQSVNTTDSAVRITHIPTGVVVTCQDEKSQHKNKAKALRVLRSRLLETLQQEQKDKEDAVRRKQVGTGDRSERIRTYNFPQSRLTDHRIGYTSKQLGLIMEGELNELIESLRTHFQAESLKA